MGPVVLKYATVRCAKCHGMVVTHMKKRLMFRMICAVFLEELFFACSAPAIERPFILWNQQDITGIRQKIETNNWAKQAYERLVKNPDRHEGSFANLLRYAVMGDKQAGQSEKDELMRMVRSPIPRGGAQYINVIRYDLLHELLTPTEKEQVQECFQTYIENAIFKRAIFDPNVFNDSRNYSRYDARVYTRTNWLPNIIWPRTVSANMMALALMDKDLIGKVWSAYGSWQWYFDECLCDTGFYAEEFGKMGSTPGAMLLYCRGLQRLDLNELGYGYKGKGGATMRGHIESLIHLGYPRVDIGSNRPHYPMVTIGDLRQSGSSQSWNLPSPAFQHSLVMGYTRDGLGGNVRWKAHGAWGGVIRGKHAQWDGYTGFTPKMQVPFWFEIARARWPDVGFDYFLAQMRGPDQDKYFPSLYFGLRPIDPDKAEAPPAPSAVWSQRGLVMLRAEESPDYWRSPAPAVAMRLATNYAHNVYDCFALAGFYAFNRPVYLNRQVTPGYAQEWSRSIQSHCGVTVDGAEPDFTDATTIRKAFTEPVKFVAARSRDVYAGVELARALMLTRGYLLDVTRLIGSQQHRYYWLVHTLGEIESRHPNPWRRSKLPRDLHPLEDVRACDTEADGWLVTALQTCALDDPSKARLPQQWYRREVGVRVSMLPQANTTVYTAQTPSIVGKKRDQHGRRQYFEQPSEVGGVTIIAAREASSTTFVALHEPFEHAPPRIVDFRRVAQTDAGLAVAVSGKPDSEINDRLLLRFGDGYAEPITLASSGETYTFADWAYLRIGSDQIQVYGDLRAATFAVDGRPELFVNGEKQTASFSGGYLSYRCKP